VRSIFSYLSIIFDSCFIFQANAIFHQDGKEKEEINKEEVRLGSKPLFFLDLLDILSDPYQSCCLIGRSGALYSRNW